MKIRRTSSFGFKLIATVAIACSVAVICVCATAVYMETAGIRQAALDGLLAQGDLLSASLVASMEFDDPQAATENLEMLNSISEIVSASIFDLDGEPFASYAVEGREPPAEMEVTVGFLFAENHLIVTRPIGRAGERLGTLRITRDLSETYLEVRESIMMSIAAGVGALILSMLLAFQLQRRLARPVLELSRVAERVSEHGDYEIRANCYSADELGALTNTFNQMLDVIQERDQALADAKTGLERRVHLRTKELQDAMQVAQAANKAKSDFLANMSHEIRTPMTAILGFGDLLLDTEQDEASRVEHVQTIRRSGQHLLDLINDILDISKIESGQFEIEMRDCRLLELVVDVTSIMRARAIEKDLTLDLRFDGPVPTVVKTDPTRLRQILVNLTGNAIKFTESGTVTICLGMRDEPGGATRLRIDVIDSGIGISPAKVTKLFRPFVQADETMSRRFGGTGLGLAISRELARMLGGDVIASSELGTGSTFTATLDPGVLDDVEFVDNISEAEKHKPRPAKSKLTPAAVSEGGPAIRVLLAEDGIDNQRLISFHLVKAGFTVEVAENGRIALSRGLAELENDTPFDVILMDMQMPEMDGYMATRSLREAKYHQPIIALTAHAMAGDRERCIDAGCDEYMTKPIDRPLLIDTILRYVARARCSTPRTP